MNPDKKFILPYPHTDEGMVHLDNVPPDSDLRRGAPDELKQAPLFLFFFPYNPYFLEELMKKDNVYIQLPHEGNNDLQVKVERVLPYGGNLGFGSVVLVSV